MTSIARTEQVLTSEAALAAIKATFDHARANGWTVATVVVDPSGSVIASARMDGVSPAILDIATDKAFTAALGKSTRAFYERMSSSPDLTLGLQNRPRFCAWDGGLPILSGGTTVGAIGVSGAEGHEDVACGQAALDAIGAAQSN